MANTSDYVTRGRRAVTDLIQVLDTFNSLQAEYQHMGYGATGALDPAFTADPTRPADNLDLTAPVFIASLAAVWATLGAVDSSTKDTIYKAKL